MPRLLRAEQVYFDRRHFDPPKEGYQRLNRRDAKIEHIGLHVGKIAGTKMLDFMHGGRMEVMTGEIIPDLAIYSTQLANLLRIPDGAFEYQPGIFSLGIADANIRRAAGKLFEYSEPRRHGPQPEDTRGPEQAAQMMYNTALDLSVEYGVIDLPSAQLERLEALMGHAFPLLGVETVDTGA